MLAAVLESVGGFFNPSRGGDPVFFQHLFWLLGQASLWLSLGVYALNLYVMITLSRRSNWGKLISAVWLGFIVYSFSIKRRYFMHMEELSGFEVSVSRSVSVAVMLVALAATLWLCARFLKVLSRQEGGAS